MKNPAILGELRIFSEKPLSDVDWNDKINHICAILSLAQRNYITKVSMYKFFDPDNKYACQELYPLKGVQATKASRYPLIAVENLPFYLKAANKKLPRVYSTWNFGIALDHYLQGQDSESAWAIGVGLVVALECLVSAYVNEDNDREFHFAKMNEFEPILPAITDHVLKQLKQHFPEPARRLKGDSAELSSWQSSFMNLGFKYQVQPGDI